MRRTHEDELVLKRHKQQQLLQMFHEILTELSILKQKKIHVHTTARFEGDEFHFDITVFELDGTNVTCTIYDFWEVKKSKKIVNAFMSAIKTDDFARVQSVCVR